jgi:hypothetical protein
MEVFPVPLYLYSVVYITRSNPQWVELPMALSHMGFGPRLEFGPAFEDSQLLAGCSVVEAKFGLLEKEGSGLWTFPAFVESVFEVYAACLSN